MLTREMMAEVYVQKARNLDGGAATQLLTYADTLRRCARLRRRCGINPCPWCLAKRIELELQKVLHHLKLDADDEFQRVSLRVPRLVTSGHLPLALDGLYSAKVKLTRGKKVWANRVGVWAGRLRVRRRRNPGEATLFRTSISLTVAKGSLDRDGLEARWRDLLLEEDLGSSSDSPLVSVADAGPLEPAVRRMCGSATKALTSVDTMPPIDVPAYLACLPRVYRHTLGSGVRPPY